jgi:HK97 family phage portal protein
MGIVNWIKTALSPNRYLASTMRLYDGMGMKGSKPRPFSYELAVRKFHTWAYAAAKLNADAVASVPKRLFVRKKTGRKLYATRGVSTKMLNYLNGYGNTLPPFGTMQKAIAFGGDVEEVIEPHPILQVLQRSNPWANGFEYDVLRMIDLQATGNSYFHVVTDRQLRTPQTVWRMPPQWVNIIPDREKFITGYLYGWGTVDQREFPADEVMHFKLPNPRDVHYGMGWYEAAWSALGLHEAKREMDTAKADNYGRPDFMISLKLPTSADTVKRLRGEFREQFEGVDKAGQFAILGGDATLTPLNWEEKEWGTGTRVIEEIAAVSGVSVAMLLTNDPNRANSEAARLGWYRNTISPYCKLDEEKLNEQWVTRFNEAEDVFIAYDPVSFEDKQAQAQQLVGYVAGGILSPNEARSEIGYAPATGADVLFPPVGGAGVSRTAGRNAPNQNTSRNNEAPGVETEKALRTGGTVPEMADNEQEGSVDETTKMKHEAMMAFIKDPTIGDVVFNQIDSTKLIEDVGFTINANYKPPVLPIVTQTGGLVVGDTVTDSTGAVVGGKWDVVPTEIISLDNTSGANHASAGKEQAGAKP